MTLALILCAFSAAQAVHWSPAAGGNGHWYEVVGTPAGIDWHTAQADASGAGGHLATIATDAENGFCFGLVDAPQYWYADSFNSNIGPWLGGWQAPGSSEPAGGWSWITGEPWTTTAWASGEPNNSGNTENALHFFHNPAPARTAHWNDITDTVATVLGYLIEYEFTLEQIVPGAAGGPNGFFTSWGNPGHRVYFLASLRTGSAPVPGCAGTAVSLMNPTLLGYGTTSGGGGASLTILIQGSLRGRTAHFQAVDRTACRVSNRVTELL
jgi:hypothetical protein